MSAYRTEKDLLGQLEVPEQALYGIHTVRALENFPLTGRKVSRALVHAFGAVKLACTRTNRELGCWPEPKAQALEDACTEMMEGRLDDHIVVDALQGGAGTSTNMNVNEVLANRALQLLDKPLGEYGTVNPLEDVNRHQSTNDTFPTALKVAAIQQLRLLEREVVALLEAFQAQEKALAHVVKIGRTQLQDAALTTLGREMSAYADAFARDRWRIYKCEERLRVVNLGGTAIGTGLAAPRQYIFKVVEKLRSITGLGLARAENLIDATQNVDAFVEVSGILKALATNLLKISGDLRFLSSGPDAGIGELSLPHRQAGSSIMPGKVNPVIPEAVSQAAMVVMSNDQTIAQACAMGHLELNPFLPLVADALLGSIDLLNHACSILRRFCVEQLEANEARCRQHVINSTASVTALVSLIGYQKATELAQQVATTGRGLRELAIEGGLVTAETFDELISPESVTRLGTPINKGPR
ncbi:aspartate ammonia-lyase [Syntrophotalea carbinolica DSM 2380]|uniref:Aspartate ammonia-lyase n=1 Tax=Syntrophotalea carbinolica (strain DSM 2380 / NBRC 103641 / GraBd1) TaxID=338963 RepID=Q3A433_SYNC1|nr:aspartate ammonia-lyase [Syntrophotalea carbinolica]ABA88874.1 aspartate ammonia-lyase [Syntrophotalea carbinolica DSM 2380]